jgi:hypothetical protein
MYSSGKIASVVAAITWTARIIGSADTHAAKALANGGQPGDAKGDRSQLPTNASLRRNQAMSTVTSSQLANPWKDLWNGDLTITPKIISQEFVAHAAPLTGSGAGEIHGHG